MALMQKEEGQESSYQKSPAVKEDRTEMLFLMGRHTVEYVEKLRDITNKKRPDFVIVEEPPNNKFQKLLEKGKTQDIKKDIEEYVKTGNYFFKEAEIEKIKLLSELNNKGTKIVQLDPGQGTNPFPLEFRAAADYRVESHIELNDFKGAVNAVIVYSAMEANEMRSRDKQRAAEITKMMEHGEIHGYVIVEAGSLHTFLKDGVMDRFKNSKDVEASSDYVTPKDVKDVFGGLAREVYLPADELIRLYESGLYGPINKSWSKKWVGRFVKDGYGIDHEEDRSFAGKLADRVKYGGEYGDERERVLAARMVVMYKMVKDMEDDKEAMQATRIVNRLGYNECEDIFNKTKGMGEEEVFRYAESYVNTRK